ncbi:MAG: hypothetical protein ACKV2Q_36465 [Planctomycetaceae bacterium]
MARPFLQRFYDDVAKHMGDPPGSRRIARSDLYEDLIKADRALWEQFCAASGQESTLGESESEISFTADEAFYPFPGEFRQFLRMEKRRNGNRNEVYDRLGTIPFNSPGPGLEIRDAQRGMVVRPMPELDDEDPWTLVYMKSTIKLHFGTAKSVSDRGLVAGPLGTDGGEIVSLPGYYDNAMIHVVSADVGGGQFRECKSSKVVDGNVSFVLRFPWQIKPTGTVVYEVCPCLPPEYDGVYALAVAAERLVGRNNPQRRASVIQQFQAAFGSAIRYLTSNTADRAPERMIPTDIAVVDPYEEY